MCGLRRMLIFGMILPTTIDRRGGAAKERAFGLPDMGLRAEGARLHAAPDQRARLGWGWVLSPADRSSSYNRSISFAWSDENSCPPPRSPRVGWRSNPFWIGHC